MDFRDLDDVIETAKEITKEAGRIILEIYEKDFSVDYKDDFSPITEADRKANDYIVKNLKSRYPECAILSEESKNDPERLKNDWCFIIDPLDGTKEFIKKNGEFTVNIALCYQGKPVLGVIGIPVTGELYFAVKGKGAFYEKDGHIERIHVSSRDIRLMMSRSHKSDKLLQLIQRNGIKIPECGKCNKGVSDYRGEAEVYYRGYNGMGYGCYAVYC